MMDLELSTHNHARGRLQRALLAVFVVAAAWQASVAQAVSIQQTFTLQPGWNAIYVELEPDNKDIDVVFSGVPVRSVWRWIPPEPGLDFVSDPAEGLLNVDGWYPYFPATEPESFLTSLFSIDANTAYLVNLQSTTPATLTITGKPMLERLRWNTGGFTLTGLPVAESGAPSFGEFFETSTAHAGQPVYKLGSGGVWQRVNSPFAEAVNSGEAYWIFTEGVSAYQGPLELDLSGSENLDFSNTGTERTVSLINNGSADVTVTVSRGTGEDMPLSYELRDPDTNEASYPDLPASLPIDVAAGSVEYFNLSTDRANFALPEYEQILEFSNGVGVRYRVVAAGTPVTVTPSLESVLAEDSTTKSGSRLKGLGVNPYAGLWLGSVFVTGVSEAQLAGVEPKQVSRPFPQKIIIHVDGNGAVRLLKEVIQMARPAVLAPAADDPANLEIVEQGNEVLITDDSLLPNFEGLTSRDGQGVGVRHSTTSYDFADQFLDVSGTFGPTGVLSVNLDLPAQFPTNPFKHRYHPDHDNLDAQFVNFQAEAFDVTRVIQLRFSVTDPEGTTPPDWGDSLMGGDYTETITGLHKNPIFLSGDFRITRITDVAVLNQ
ncbi:MAG: hypothetical protein QNJ40_08160 [Xanthomonadales bacterium]|nr:hypothetical protein [Xanthomonadales bacterium]